MLAGLDDGAGVGGACPATEPWQSGHRAAAPANPVGMRAAVKGQGGERKAGQRQGQVRQARSGTRRRNLVGDDIGK